MSGHSKWATIKHKKGALDAKRGKIFTRLDQRNHHRPPRVAAIRTRTPVCAPPLLPPKPRTCRPTTSSVLFSVSAPANCRGVNYEEFMLEGYGPGGWRC